jgi:hypothetical protein
MRNEVAGAVYGSMVSTSGMLDTLKPPCQIRHVFFACVFHGEGRLSTRTPFCQIRPWFRHCAPDWKGRHKRHPFKTVYLSPIHGQIACLTGRGVCGLCVTQPPSFLPAAKARATPAAWAVRKPLQYAPFTPGLSL